MGGFGLEKSSSHGSLSNSSSGAGSFPLTAARCCGASTGVLKPGRLRGGGDVPKTTQRLRFGRRRRKEGKKNRRKSKADGGGGGKDTDKPEKQGVALWSWLLGDGQQGPGPRY